MNIDLFAKETMITAQEKAGGLALKKGLAEERHKMKKTEEEYCKDFEYNIGHPFIAYIENIASAYAKNGKTFVLADRIAVLKDKNSNAREAYFNGGKTWRQSGNALTAKWLKENYPSLDIPMKYGVKGEDLLIEKNPGKFEWLKEIRRERFKEAVNQRIRQRTIDDYKKAGAEARLIKTLLKGLLKELFGEEVE